MKEDTIALLGAARKATRPRWPCVEIDHLPEGRDVSRPGTGHCIIWPGYGPKKSLKSLLYFRRENLISIEGSECIEPLLDPQEIFKAAKECAELAAELDRKAQAVLNHQRRELAVLLAEAEALNLSGLTPQEPAGNFLPLFPVVHRLLSVHRACMEGLIHANSVRRFASAIVMGEAPLAIQVESQPQVYGQSVNFIITNTGEARLCLFAELRGERAVVSWHITTSEVIQSVASYSYTANAITLSRVCRTPYEAVALKDRLDIIITALRGESWN